MLVFAWQVQHFNALSLVAVLARFCFQSLAAVKKYRLWRCVGVLDARVYYKKPIACGSTLLRLMHSRMQGRFYEEGSDIVHVPSFDAFHATCGCCCKHEFCCAVGCAAALARTVAQIRMMHVCLYLYIKRPDPATQA